MRVNRGAAARRAAFRLGACLGAAAVLTGTAGVILAGPASAGFVSQGLASAVGERVTVYSDSAPLDNTPADVSMPLAAAAVDARGNSLGQAADPYPGDFATYGVTGAAAPDLPAGFAPPAVPANETSQYPTTPSAHMDVMAYQLFADSSQFASTATATSGASNAAAGSAGTNAATAAVTVNPATGQVDAASTSMSSPLSIGPLSMGAVQSHVTLRRLPGGALTRDAGVTVGQSSVAGQMVSIGPGGLTVPGAGTTPLPGQADMVTSALAAAGITMTYLAEIDTADGTVAPGVQVQQKQTSDTGQVTMTTYILGQASASATTSGKATTVTPKPAPKASPSPTTHAPSSSAPTSAAPAATPTPKKSGTSKPSATPSPHRPTAAATSASVPPTLPPAITAPPPGAAVVPIVPVLTSAGGAVTAPPETTVSPVALAPSSAAGASSSAGAVVPAEQPQATAPAATLAALRRTPDGFGASASSFYLVLVAGGIVLLASSASVRALGVRLLWTR